MTDKRMVSVPVEPTEAMWKAAREVWEGHEKPYTFDCTKDAFLAMLLSAPVAPVWVGIDVAEDAPAEFKMFAAEFNRLRSARGGLAPEREEGGRWTRDRSLKS